MTSRRDLLGRGAGVVAGIMLTGCSSLSTTTTPPAWSASNAWRPSPGDPSVSRLPVTVGGRRVRTIDVHAHCYIQEAIALMGADANGVLPTVKGAREHFVVVADRLAAMDAMGVDIEVVSTNPFWYRRERDNAAAIVQVQNSKMSELCVASNGRINAFASLSLQFPDLAIRQLEEAMKLPGIRGAAIGGSVAGAEFSEPQFHPVWERAQALGAVLFIHPQSTPELARRFKGNGWMSNVVGNPLDTTLALEHLIYEGVLDKFPDLKICAAHGGGYVGMNAPRMDFSCYVSPVGCNPDIKLRLRPSEYVRRIYFDSLVFTPEALRHLVAEVGASQVMMGTDFPIPWELHPVDHVMHTPELSDADRIAILGGIAARLLGLDAAPT
jgi:aminocarboxymuconate-semialdehyde decarboxylase